MSDNIIEFSIANQAATHLGRKLYNSNPPALAELVAILMMHMQQKSIL